MRQLMISLDRKIIEESRVAQRMKEYGNKDKIFILIPGPTKKMNTSISENVKVEMISGSKFVQFFSLIWKGLQYVSSNDVTFITTQDPFFTGLVGLLIRFFSSVLLKDITLEVQLHGDFYSNSYYKKSIRYFLGKFVIKRADKIRVASKRARVSLENRTDLKIGKGKVRIKPVFIDERSFVDYGGEKNYLRKRYHTINTGKIFLWVGRMEPVKNLEFLLNIFVKAVKQWGHSDWLLVLVGEGSQRKELEDIVDKSGLLNTNIQFESWTEEPVKYYKSADCLVFPSLSEGYGQVPMEAYYSGCPVIMSDVGVANYELKPSDRVKILPFDERAWIEAMSKI